MEKSYYFVSQSAFMTNTDQHLAALQDIKQMMEKSSRFISLSGLSGVAAGICALAGAAVAHQWLQDAPHAYLSYSHGEAVANTLTHNLLLLAIVVFSAAFALATLFTWLRSRKTGVPIWGTTARRLMVAVSVPLLIGGLFVLKLAETGAYGLLAPACLIFYGLALLNASRYTLTEIKYLAYLQLLLGAGNLWLTGYGLYFWAIGFGVLHVIYGIAMWYKYERV
jgi:hypothetical protein